MATLNERLESVEKQLKDVLKTLANKDKEQSTPLPKSVVGGQYSPSLGKFFNYKVPFNDSELLFPGKTSEPNIPTVSFNKHIHSDFSGGMLLAGYTEMAEYEVTSFTNPHCPDYWDKNLPKLKTVKNTEGETVEKKGIISLAFNPNAKTWGMGDIDVQLVNFVMYNTNGTIKTDVNGIEMKSPIYNADIHKTSILWDVNGKCWRFLAVYSS